MYARRSSCACFMAESLSSLSEINKLKLSANEATQCILTNDVSVRSYLVASTLCQAKPSTLCQAKSTTQCTESSYQIYNIIFLSLEFVSSQVKAAFWVSGSQLFHRSQRKYKNSIYQGYQKKIHCRFNRCTANSVLFCNRFHSKSPC